MPLDPVSSGDPHVPAHNAERTAINNLETQMATKITLPGGAATGDLLTWDGVAWVTTLTRFFEGNGRPDGRFAAPVGSRYIDKLASRGAVEWVKRSGGDTVDGWLVLGGDTGLRDISSLFDPLPNGAVVNEALAQRVGSVVSMYFDLTMPSQDQATWKLFSALPGFGPGHNRRAALQDNREVANTGGTMVDTDGGVFLYNTLSGRRDRYAGTWVTPMNWPASLPGVEV